jgi:methyl coenzyme M reductase alpha subunit
MHNSFEQVLGLIVDVSGGVNVYDITKYKEYPTLILE